MYRYVFYNPRGSACQQPLGLARRQEASVGARRLTREVFQIFTSRARLN